MTRIEAARGLRFLFDRTCSYIDQVNDYQLAKSIATDAPATRATRASALKAMLSWFEDNALDWRECTELAHMNLMHLHYRGTYVSTPIGEKKSRISKVTWNQWIGYWMRFLRYAKSRDWIEDIGFEMADVKERGKSDPFIRALLPDEFRVFLDQITTQRLRAGVYVMVGTGIRISENAALKCQDVPTLNEFRGESYRPRKIVGKGAKEREILWPFSAAKSVWAYHRVERSLALEVLRERITLGKRDLDGSVLQRGADERGAPALIERPDAALWLTEEGEPLSLKRWSKEFTSAQEDVGTHISPHWLRHTYAVVTLSKLIKQQIKMEIAEQKLGSSKTREYFRDPVQEVRTRLGHASTETTMVYLNHIAEHRHLLNQAVQDLQRDYLDA